MTDKDDAAAARIAHLERRLRELGEGADVREVEPRDAISKWTTPFETPDAPTLARLRERLAKLSVVAEAWVVGVRTTSGENKVEEDTAIALLLDPGLPNQGNVYNDAAFDALAAFHTERFSERQVLRFVTEGDRTVMDKFATHIYSRPKRRKRWWQKAPLVRRTF